MSLMSLFLHPQCDQLSWSKILGSHGGDIEDCCLVGCDAVCYPDVGDSRRACCSETLVSSNFLAVFVLLYFV
jgi:hypothetical protein